MAGHGLAVRTSVAFLSLCMLTRLTTAESNIALWSNSTTVSSEHDISKPKTSSSGSSTATSTTTSDDIGGFVAAGMGMSRTSSSATVSETTSSSSTTSVGPDPFTHPDTSAPLVTAAPIGNYTLSFTSGNCWQQWSAYWSANDSASDAHTYTTSLFSNVYTATLFSVSASTIPVSGTTTVTVYNGAHPQATYTTVTELSSIYTQITRSPTYTYTSTFTKEDGSSIDLFGNGTLVKPTCVLPSYVPECQTSWEDWIYHKYGHQTAEEPVGCTSNLYSSVQAPECSGPVSSYLSADSKVISLAIRDSPSCTQAFVTGSWCSTLYDAFQSDANYYGHLTNGVVGGGMNWTTYTTTTGTHKEDVATITTNHFFWDPSSTFAPGCSLGCQSCAVMGGTVQLIYWPPASSTWINGNYSAITGNATEMATIETLGTTLTSPTVYVSFDSLYARDSCSFFGKTHYDQIVAITNTADLSSIHGWGRYNGLGSSASFNFTDLYVSPVPDYIYQSQPRCASSMAMFDPRRGRPETMPANWTCPRTADYDPILAIPLEVRDIDPDWAKCAGGIDGVYDPPIALTPKGSIALPTVPGKNPEDSPDATPAPTPKPTDAPNTSPPQPDKPSKTAAPEEDPDSTSDPEVKPPSFGPDPTDSPSPVKGEDPKDTQGAEGTQLPEKPTDQPGGDNTKAGSPTANPDPPAQGSSEQDPPADPQTSNPSNEAHEGSGNKNAQNDPEQDSPARPKTSDPGNEAQEGSVHDDPASPTGPLSILISALDSAKSEQTGKAGSDGNSPPSPSGSHDTNSPAGKGPADESDSDQGSQDPKKPQDPSDPSDPSDSSDAEPFTGNPPSPQNVPSATVISLQDGGSAKVHETGGSFIIEQEGLSAGATQGGVATIGTHVYSAASDGGAIIVDNSATHAVPPPAAPTKQNDGPAAVWTQAGETFSALVDGSSVVLQGSGVTTTLLAGATATIAGEQVSVLTSDGVLVLGESTVSLEQNAAGGKGGAATTLVNDGETVVASASGSNIVLQHGSSAVTLEAGQQTVVDGQTFSVAPSGGAVVFNGSETFSLPPVRTAEDATGSSTNTDSTASTATSATEADASETNASATGSNESGNDGEVESADSAASRIASGLPFAGAIVGCMVALLLV